MQSLGVGVTLTKHNGPSLEWTHKVASGFNGLKVSMCFYNLIAFWSHIAWRFYNSSSLFNGHNILQRSNAQKATLEHSQFFFKAFLTQHVLYKRFICDSTRPKVYRCDILTTWQPLWQKWYNRWLTRLVYLYWSIIIDCFNRLVG